MNLNFFLNNGIILLINYLTLLIQAKMIFILNFLINISCFFLNLKKINSVECTYNDFTFAYGYQTKKKDCSDIWYICCPESDSFRACCVKNDPFRPSTFATKNWETQNTKNDIIFYSLLSIPLIFIAVGCCYVVSFIIFIFFNKS